MSGSLEKGFPLLIPRTVPVSAGWAAGGYSSRAI